jgi:hypothetical protein
VPKRSGTLAQPNTYIAKNQQWPHGKLAPNAPFEATIQQRLSRRLDTAIGNRSLRNLSAAANVSPQTISALIKGTTWGDLVTLARLEHALNTTLWER